MNCEKFAQMLDRYADLSEMELAQLDEHAAICDNCRAELEFMRSIIGTAQSLPPIEPPTDFLETLNARLDAEIAAEPKIVYFVRQAKPYINRYGTIAACLVVGIVIGANGNMLVSRMNDDSNGVISTTSVVTDNSTTPVADSGVVPQATPEAVVSNTNPEVNNGTAVVKNNDTAATVNSPSVYVSTITPSPAAAVATEKPVTPTATTVTPVATAAPVITAAPVVDEVQPEMPQEDNNAGIMIASLDMAEPEMPVGRSIRMIEEPEATPEMYAAAEVEENVAAEYSIATIQPQSETAYVAPLSSTLMIKAKDEARAKEIIMEFVEATYGNYYMITGDKLYNLTLRLESEGIWYQANITDSGVKVSFKLVTM